MVYAHGNRMKSLKLYFLQICKDLSHRPLGDASKNYKKTGCTAISLRSMGQKITFFVKLIFMRLP